jgi:hypothetical protein
MKPVIEQIAQVATPAKPRLDDDYLPLFFGLFRSEFRWPEFSETVWLLARGRLRHRVALHERRPCHR